jgi:hypothetical protein
MPPLAVWKIRPSRVVPYRLIWARSSLTSSGGMGMVRVSARRLLRRAVGCGVPRVVRSQAACARLAVPSGR